VYLLEDWFNNPALILSTLIEHKTYNIYPV